MFYTKEKLEETKQRRELHRQAVERRLALQGKSKKKPKPEKDEKDSSKVIGYLGDTNELGR